LAAAMPEALARLELNLLLCAVHGTNPVGDLLIRWKSRTWSVRLLSGPSSLSLCVLSAMQVRGVSCIIAAMARSVL